MIEVEHNEINIKDGCRNHNAVWFPIHTFFDLEIGECVIDCICLKCKMVHTFQKNTLCSMPNVVPVEVGMIVPLSLAIHDYDSLKNCYQEHMDILKNHNPDKIICKTMKKRYANKYE